MHSDKCVRRISFLTPPNIAALYSTLPTLEAPGVPTLKFNRTRCTEELRIYLSMVSYLLKVSLQFLVNAVRAGAPCPLQLHIHGRVGWTNVPKLTATSVVSPAQVQFIHGLLTPNLPQISSGRRYVKQLAQEVPNLPSLPYYSGVNGLGFWRLLEKQP